MRSFLIKLCSLSVATLLVASPTQLVFAFSRPNDALTPGATVPGTREEVCSPGYAKRERHPYDSAWRHIRVRVFREYGIPHSVWRNFTVDHRVPIEALGDPFNIRNLWPEPKAEAKDKDQYEDRAHAEICAGVLSIGDAQRAFESDWTTIR